MTEKRDIENGARKNEDSYWFMHANCKMQEMANWCVPVVWQARRRREGIERKRCEAGAKR